MGFLEKCYCFGEGISCDPHYDGGRLANGVADCTNHNAYNSFCTFQCNEGYRLLGGPEARCTESSRWTNEKPSCEL